MRRSMMERLMGLCVPEPNTGCWLWLGCVLHNGYGQIATRRGHHPARAHRVAWELFRGPIPEGLCVLHRCDVRPCVNPDHLFLGTPAENTEDMFAKGRWRQPPPVPDECKARGEQHNRAKLTENMVREIRALADTHSKSALARRFGVGHTTISHVIARLNWKHVA